MEKPNFKNRSRLVRIILSVLVVLSGISSCRPDFDLDKRMPEWLGTSIYETLKEGFGNDSTGEFYTFNTFVKLIEDLDQVKILNKTGSKTLFVADDSAFARFFKDCPFKGVTDYSQLTIAQKKMILNGSMLNNVYQISMLSSSPGGEQNPPLLGNCMRRVSASQLVDTIPLVFPKDMPDNSYWTYQRENKDKGIILLQDGTNKPLTFFVHKFMQMHGFDNDDYDFLFRLGRYSRPDNPRPAHNPADASVNGVTVACPNKKCFNGFLHVMSDVVYLLPNMAEALLENPETTIYSSIIERFAVPFWVSSEKSSRDDYLRTLVAADDTKIITNEALRDYVSSSGARDSLVYVKKYLSQRSTASSSGSGNASAFNKDERGRELLRQQYLLKFDPGWNSLIAPSSNSNDIALQEDIAVMFVPVDSAISKWWQQEDQVGARLRERYGKKEWKDRHDLSYKEVIEDMKGVPLKVIIELLNNNMQNSLVSSVPSKFSTVLNDAQDPFFEKMSRAEAEATIGDVEMCCNGAIYYTTQVYTPTAYRSVSYPVITNEKLDIINWAVTDVKLAYKAYLNSMVAEYSFFVPVTDSILGSEFENKLVWIDPASFYLDKLNSEDKPGSIKALAFSYGKQGSTETVMADVYDYNNGTFVKTSDRIIATTDDNAAGTQFIRNRLMDLMDYHIVVGEVESATVPSKDGYSYFRTKGRGTVRFKNSATFGDKDDMEIAGGWQIENEDSIDAVQRPARIIDRVDLNRYTSKTIGNGRTYLIDRPLLPPRRSVYDIVSDTLTYPEFTSFFKLMQLTDVFASKSNRNEITSVKCISTFSAYHYTVYIPKNAGVDTLLAHRVLLLPDELAAIDSKFRQLERNLNTFYGSDPDKETKVREALRDSLLNISGDCFGITDTAVIERSILSKGRSDPASLYFTNKKRNQLNNFVKYHIQDNSLFVGADFDAGVDAFTGEVVDKAEYESAYLNENNQFVKLKVKGGNDIEIYDNNGHIRKVDTTLKNANGKPYYNIMCRETEVKALSSNTSLSNENYSTQFKIEATSYAVVHLIDEPLCSGDIIF